MAIKMIFDPNNNVQVPTMVLTYRSGKSIGAVIPHNVHYSGSLNAQNEFAFDVYKDLDNDKCDCWQKLTDFKLIYCVEWDAFFEIYVEIDESDETIKHIQGKALAEAELSQNKIYGLEVNTELDISREDYKPTIIYSKDAETSLIHKLLEKTPNFTIGHIDASIAKLQRTFTFDDKTIYEALQEISEEVDCLIALEAKRDEDWQINRIVNIYDLRSHCEECGCRDIEGDVCPEYAGNKSGHPKGGKIINPGYGNDTEIFVSTQNLADNITYSSGADSVKNCFKLTAGDDLMTATIRNCAPTKSGYLWHFTEDTKADMSDSLREVLNRYQQIYNEYNTEFKNDANGTPPYGAFWGMSVDAIRTKYNEICKRYDKEDCKASESFKNFAEIMSLYYNAIDMELYLKSGMMPSTALEATTATEEIKKVKTSVLSPIAVQDAEKASLKSVDNAVLGIVKALVDSRYKVEISNSNLIGQVWSGRISLEKFSNEDDAAYKDISGVIVNDDLKIFTEQKIKKALAKEKNEAPDVVSLFDKDENDFKKAIKQYALSFLNSFRDAGQACLNLMIEMGITNTSSHSTTQDNKKLYDELYVPYYNKVGLLDVEILVRQGEIYTITGRYNSNGNLIADGLITYLDKLIADLQENLNLEKFIEKQTGSQAENLLKELVSFRREDTYKNDNYVSEGLDNAQLFKRALEFVAEAEKDIISSATPVHTISSTLKNLLAMKEFKPLIDNFELGNWIRVEIDDSIFKLRLIRYEIDFDNFENITVEFSDVQLINDNISDIKSILNQASSIASNYSNIKILTNQNKKSGDYVWEWVNDGLALTKIKIIDEAENQNISWDEHGFLCREYSPITDSYENEQIKIINKGLYVTDDNWKTSKAGIGNFIYFNPKDNEYHDGYGVIADTLVGNLILSKEVGIYNETGSVQIDSNGFVITTKNQAGEVFKIRKETETADGEGSTVLSYEDLLYTDADGNLHIKGEITATSLVLGENVDLSDSVDLSGCATKSDLNGYLTKTEYSSDKSAIETSLNSQITRIGTVENKAVFLAKTYSNSAKGYEFSVSTDGLLQAKNAVITGTIYATGGEFVGSLKSGVKSYTINSTNYYNYNFNASNGKIELGLNSDGTYNMTVNDDGTIVFGNNVSLSWNNISGVPATSEGLTEAQVTAITKNTVNTGYVNSLNVTAGSVKADWVYAGNISASQITTGKLKSENYTETDLSGTTGSVIDLTSGGFNLGGGSLKYNDGTLSVDGDITAKKLNISEGATFSGTISSSDSMGLTTSWNLSTGVFNVKREDYDEQIAMGSNSLNRVQFQAETCFKNTYGQKYSKGIIIHTACSNKADTSYMYYYARTNLYSTFEQRCPVIKFYDERIEETTDGNYYITIIKPQAIRTKNIACQSILLESDEILTTDNIPYTTEARFYFDDKGYFNTSGMLNINSPILISETSVDGYYYEGKFYEDIEHTKLISDRLYYFYYDKDTKKYYMYSSCGNGYEEVDSSLASRRFEIDRDIYLHKAQHLYDYDTGYNIIGVWGNQNTTPTLQVGDSSMTTRLYGANIYLKNTSTAVTSDQRFKNNIQSFRDIHERLFKALHPVSFEYTEGASNRTHYGFIAQEVRDAALSVGLTTQDIAAFVEMDSDREGFDTEYALRYDEFISLNTHMIQKCLKDIEALKTENNELKNRLDMLKENG